MGNSPAKWRVQNNIQQGTYRTHYNLLKWQNIFAGRTESQVLTVLPLDRGNKSPYTLEDSSPDCMLGTSLHKLCHTLLCILLLIGHRNTSTTQFCDCLMGEIAIFFHRQIQAWKGQRKWSCMPPKTSIISKACSPFVIFLTSLNSFSWCRKYDHCPISLNLNMIVKEQTPSATDLHFVKRRVFSHRRIFGFFFLLIGNLLVHS